MSMVRVPIAVRLLAATAVLLTFSGCDGYTDGDDSTKVNGSIHATADKPFGDVKTVNGSIHIDDKATVAAATTVNGSVRLGANATATSIDTVNGAISLGPGAHAASAKSVNGDLSLSDGAEIAGALANVNGKISLTAAHVGGRISTVSGDISVLGASHVDGGILVKKPGDSGIFNSPDPVIVIGPGATIQGEMRFERKVKLFVSDKATIGAVTGATAVPFTGDTPPKDH